MSVRFGLADIQGNSFEKLTGKPFVDLKPKNSQVNKLLLIMFDKVFLHQQPLEKYNLPG